jgi:diguanylate cyclase (GGDEF)-like protein
MSLTEPSSETHLLQYRKSFLLLRWLLIILGSYLTLFPRLGSPTFLAVFGFAIAFAATNLGASIIRPNLFNERFVQNAIKAADIIFVAVTCFLLRGQDTYLYLSFIGVFLLAFVWRDLKVLLFGIFVVSVLSGIFVAYRMFWDNLNAAFVPEQITPTTSDFEQFAFLSMFFLVSLFYLFLTEQMQRHAAMSTTILEEKQRAEVTVEIACALSSSVNSHAILSLIARRLCDVMGASDCTLGRVDSQRKAIEVVATYPEQNAVKVTVDIAVYAELSKAYETGEVVFVSSLNGDRAERAAVAAPMLVDDAVIGLIHLKFAKVRKALSGPDNRFLQVMSGTAASALLSAQLFEEVEHRARTDFLTNLPNHWFFQSQLSNELARAQRYNHPLSLMIVDLDFLKTVNDRFGHPSGDMVIRGIGETIRKACRESDFAARYGGEEYTVILPETTLEEAVRVAERVRAMIAAHEFTGIGTVTASIGVANFPINALGKEDLIRIADHALYVAKNSGRDRVSYFTYQLITQ